MVAALTGIVNLYSDTPEISDVTCISQNVGHMILAPCSIPWQRVPCPDSF